MPRRALNLASTSYLKRRAIDSEQWVPTSYGNDLDGRSAYVRFRLRLKSQSSADLMKEGKKMKRFAIPVLVLLSLFAVLVSSSVFASSPETGDVQVARYLQSIHFPSEFRRSAQERLRQASVNSPTAQHLSELTDQQILTALVPLVHAQLSDDEARILADFFSSPAAQSIANHQALTADQQAQVDQFRAKHGSLVSRMNQFFRDPNEQRQILAALLTVK